MKGPVSERYKRARRHRGGSALSGRPTRLRHPVVPVPARGDALAGAPPPAARLGRAHRRLRDRGRLRQRVPIPGRSAADERGGPPQSPSMSCVVILTGGITSGKFPPMKAVRADTKRRVVIPGARPGDIFDVQRQGEERFVLVRLHRPPEAPRMSREACLDAMSRSPLNPTLSWEQLRRITREP